MLTDPVGQLVLFAHYAKITHLTLLAPYWQYTLEKVDNTNKICEADLFFDPH